MKFTFPPESKPLDGYTIKRGIHRGGFGEVYYALSDGGKEVALKLLQQNLEVELRGVSHCLNLKHPHLVTIFDIRTDGDGDHWIVMEYISGRGLDQVLQNAKAPLSMEETRLWFDGIAAGLGFLHDRGIVHRDLKPANVFREADVVKIGDVGLAKFISESRRDAQTQSVGTVYYMAPEVAHGRYGREVDIYSLGVILYEMLTGDVPFDGESTAEILMKHLTEPPDLSPLPPRLRPVIARALEKDPSKRISTTAEFAAEFYKALDDGDVDDGDVPIEIPETAFVPFSKPERKTTSDKPATSAEQGRGDRRRSRPRHRYRSEQFSPSTLRTISSRQRLSELSGSMTFAVFCTAAVTAVLCAVSLLDDPGNVGLFAVTTLAASWIVLCLSKFWEGVESDPVIRRLTLAAAGILIGLAASWFDSVLLVDFSPTAADNSIALVQTVGSHRLLDTSGQPATAAYVLFFAGLLSLRRWWRQADSFRSSRFRISSTLLTLLVASLLNVLFAFPSYAWGVSWALAISSVVQLSAVWVPPGQRFNVMEALPNANA